MARFLVKLSDGANPSSIQPTLLSTQGVRDVTQSRSFNGFVVSGDAGTKSSIANQPGVEAVYDDIQAVPQVADQQSTEEFLDTVKSEVGEEDAAPLVETKPTTSGDE